MKILKDVFDRELIEDIKNLKYDEVFEKYSEVYPAFYQTDFGEWEAVCGGYRQWVDDNFMRLDFKPIWGDIVGVLRTRMALRVVMKPTIDVNGLLFNAYVDFNNLVKKKEGGFPISQLKEAVLEVRQLSMSDIKFKYHNEIEKAKSGRPKSGYICRDVHSSVVKKFDIDNAIKFYYNPNLDLKDNLDNLNRNGVDITLTRLLQYLEEFGEEKKKENDCTRKMPVTYPDKLKVINVDANAVISLLKILAKRVEMTSKEPFVEGTILSIKMLIDKMNKIKDLCEEETPPEKKVKKVKKEKEEDVFPIQDLPSIGARCPTIIDEIPSIDAPCVEEEDMYKGKNLKRVLARKKVGEKSTEEILNNYNEDLPFEENYANMKAIGLNFCVKTVKDKLRANGIVYFSRKKKNNMKRDELILEIVEANPTAKLEDIRQLLAEYGFKPVPTIDTIWVVLNKNGKTKGIRKCQQLRD